MSGPLSLEHGPAYQELREWPWDPALRETAERAIATQRVAATAAVQATFRPDASGGDPVSPRALAELLEADREVKGLATEREISNAIPFNQPSVEGSMRADEVARRRRRLDAKLVGRIGELFPEGEDPVLAPSGQYWYPPGGYMGWHTNSAFPGWRMYISHAEEPGRSFFRYRDPETGGVITSVDAEWTVRLFRVAAERHLWHAIYSETNRFSLGYVVSPWTPIGGAKRLARRALQALNARGLPVPAEV